MPKFLQPEIWPYASVTVVPANAIVVPQRFSDVSAEQMNLPCAGCLLPVRAHFDGFDGNHLDCEEARRRARGRA